MGLNLILSGGSRPNSNTCQPVIAQPNPFLFKILKEEFVQNKFDSYVLAQVQYPDATNFEGNKILLVKGRTTLKGLKELDPHFLKHSNVELIARFRPDEDGWRLGMALMRSFKNPV